MTAREIVEEVVQKARDTYDDGAQADDRGARIAALHLMMDGARELLRPELVGAGKFLQHPGEAVDAHEAAAKHLGAIERAFNEGSAV